MPHLTTQHVPSSDKKPSNVSYALRNALEHIQSNRCTNSELTAVFVFSALHVAIVIAVFVLAGMVKGMTGMGLPTVAMGALGAVMSPATAASLLIVPSFVTNVWQLLSGPQFLALVSRLWLMMLGIVVGTVAGSRLLTSSSSQWTMVSLGVVLLAYAMLSLLARPLTMPAHFERWVSPIVGMTTGLITGGTGVFVIPAVPYLQALALSKDDLVQALGLSFTVSTVALTIGLARDGALELGNVVASGLAVIPALIGMGLGQLFRQRFKVETFRFWFLICLACLGLDLAIRPFL